MTLSVPAHSICTADRSHVSDHAFFRILENDSVLEGRARMMGGCPLGREALWLSFFHRAFFFFPLACPQPSLGGFLDRGPRGCCLKTCSLGHSHHSSLTQAHCSSSPGQCSSMALWGTCLLLCLISLLNQVTMEPPTPKVKKTANVKKGKEGGGSWSPFLCWSSCSFPSSSSLTRPGNFSKVPPGAWVVSPVEGLSEL